VTSQYPPIVLQATGVYDREGAYIWWRSANNNLNGRRPVDLWNGQPTDRDAVRAEIERLTGDLNV
jgi:hypothetical protein